MLSGSVLGLRLRVSCDTSLVSKLFSWVFDYLDVFEDAQAFVKLLPIGGTTVLSAITTARGSRFACGAQATPREDVDVTLGYGGHDVPPPLLLQVPERTIIISKLLVGSRCLSKGWLDTHW